MKVVLIAAVLALSSVGGWAAETANPLLVARPRGVETGRPSQALKIAKLDVSVTLIGGLAQTTIEARFDNPTSQIMEGDFTLALPAGAVVDGYALDVGGRMVDGVLTGKRQAKLVYEERVRAGVDPGLAEVTADNSFHTRVFPILPGRGRTIRLAYASPLTSDGRFILPLASAAAVGETVVSVRVLGAATVPTLSAPAGLKLVWGEPSDDLVAKASAKDATLDGALTVGAWRPAQPIALSRHANGERFFELQLPYDVSATLVRRLRLYWDRSRSRTDDDLAAEIAVLRRYVDAVRPQSVELVTFASDVPRASVLPAPTGEALETALKAVTYGGASTLKGVFATGTGAVDTCILVTDGRMTLDGWSAAPPPCRTLTLSSAKDADRAFLAVLAQRGGGRHVDLSAIDAEAALARLAMAGAPAFALKTMEDQAVEHRLIAGAAGRWWIIGKTPATSALVFTADGGTRRVLSLDGPVRDFDATGAIWGREAVASLLATDRPDRDEALALARRYDIATQEASFVVLETPQDYVDAGAAPPSSAGAALVDGYRDAVARNKVRETLAAASRLNHIAGLWAEQKAWWEKSHKAPKRVRRDHVSADDEAPPWPSAAPAVMALAPEGYADTSVEEVAVTGSRGAAAADRAMRRASMGASASANAAPPPPPAPGEGPSTERRIVVAAAAWNPDRPYLKALEAASVQAWRPRYAALEKQYGDAPAFYFDVAEWLFRSGRKAEAVEVVVNALDVPGADGRTLIIVADRLQAYGDLDRAIWLRERMLFLEPDRPQPRRDLALALIARGDGATGKAREADYRRALDLLNAVIVRPWNNDYDGIEVIALMEANHLVARMKALGLDQTVLDPRFTALLDVDIRAVLEWNTDKTDMDLWVDEPTGERAIYNHPATAIGGRLSNDMTRGFGPEEYLLRRAPDGGYVLRVNVYASDVLDPNGPSTVRVRLFRDWGRPGEAQETFTIELKKGDDGAMTVGRFEIGGRK